MKNTKVQKSKIWENFKFKRCENLKSKRWENVKSKRCENVKSKRCENVKSNKSIIQKMWNIKKINAAFENPKKLIVLFKSRTNWSTMSFFD